LTEPFHDVDLSFKTQGNDKPNDDFSILPIFSRTLARISGIVTSHFTGPSDESDEFHE
jgi:hypothetical protein